MKHTTALRLRRMAALFCAAALLCFFAGCSKIGELVPGVPVPTGEYPVTIGEVTISAKPQKAVVLSPALADVILALGCETQLAAGSEECTQDGLRSLAKIDGSDPEGLLAAVTPDLVISDAFTPEMSRVLSENNVPMLELALATDREDFERLYAQVSSAFLGGGPGYDKGIQVAQGIFTTLDDINRIVPKDKITTACYLYDLDGRAVTGDMFGSTIMSYAGVTNVFQSLTGGTYDFESLRITNPYAIFCVPGLKSRIESDSRFEKSQAVRNGRVYEMEPERMEWQGRTIIMTAYEISEKCFPELTEETSMVVTDPTEQIDEVVSSVMESSTLEADDTPYETLKEGQDGEDVLKMQTRLDELGYLKAEYDGYYGSHTASCVKEFQRVNGLEETGVANAETLRKLYSKLAKPAESSGD